MKESIGFLIHDTARLYRARLNEQLRGSGVTALQWRTLGYLSRNEGTNQAALAELLEVEPITLSRMIDRLAELELVERRPAEFDRRSKCLFLTSKARPMIAGLLEQVGILTETASQGLSAAERDTLGELLERMHGNLSRRASDDDEQLIENEAA
jgi:DNA-binding MarR family transcriptional regulator